MITADNCIRGMCKPHWILKYVYHVFVWSDLTQKKCHYYWKSAIGQKCLNCWCYARCRKHNLTFFLRFPQRSNWQKVSLFINFIFNGDVYIDGHHREPVQMQMVPLFYSHNFRININVVMISYVKKTSLFPVLTTITNFLFHRSPCECVWMTPV